MEEGSGFASPEFGSPLHREHSEREGIQMQQIELNAELRVKSGKGEAHRLRREKRIPAVYYGKGEDNILLSVDPHLLEKAVSGKGGMNALIKLKVNQKGDYNVLLRDYQAHPISRKFLHVDFVHVDLSKKIRVSIPVHLVGTAVGIKEGGILQHVTRELEVLCLPSGIPQAITADVSQLKVGQNLHLHEIKLPEGVEAVGGTDVTIAAVIAPKEEELTPGVIAEPEVLTARKEEGEGVPSGTDERAKAAASEGKEEAKKEVKKEAKDKK